MATTFPTNNYDPRLIVVDESNGSTLTRAAIRAFTRQDFEDQAFKEVGMDRVIASTKEGRMAGVKENSLVDLLLSRHVALGEKKGGGSQSIVAPYVLVPRRNVVNANWFKIEGSAAGPTNATNGQRVFTVNNGSVAWNSTNKLKSLEKYFLPGNQFVVEYLSGADSVIAHFTIQSAVNANAGGVEKAAVTAVPNKTATWWAAASAGDKAVYEPTSGVITLLANSTSDYESWGHQMPAVNDLTLCEYWQQTHRWAHSYNDEYVKALEAPLTSEFFKKFRQLPLAKQRKQQEALNQAILLNTFFYGDALNENQTVEGYRNLPIVSDPADPNFPIEFKSNTIGCRAQLSVAGRVADKAGVALDLSNWFEDNFNLKRYRDGMGDGEEVTVIDWMTDRLTRGRINTAMVAYYKARYGIDNVQLYIQVNQKITHDGRAVFEYDLYDLPDHGMQVAVFSPLYFWDRLAFHGGDIANNVARCMWAIDWSDVMINVLKTSSVSRTTNLADELYRYIIQVNATHTQLNSKTFEVRVGDPNRHLLYENLGATVQQ